MLLTALLFLAALGAAGLDFVQGLEWRTEDARLKIRAARGEAPHEALALVGIDEASITTLGQ